MTAIEKLKEVTKDILAQQLNAVDKKLVLFADDNGFTLQMIELYMRSQKLRNCITAKSLDAVKNIIEITAKDKINVVVLDLDFGEYNVDINTVIDMLKEKNIHTIIYSGLENPYSMLDKRHSDIAIIKKGNESTLKELYMEILKHQ